MRRLAFAAAVCGTLVLAACNDQTQSPTEPNLSPPGETFGTTCTVVRFPLLTPGGVAEQIIKVFPPGRLRLEALAGATAVALLWDTCHPDAARRAAIALVNWIDKNAANPTSTPVMTLKRTILNAVGIPFDIPTTPGDAGIGFFDHTSNQALVVATTNGTALTEIPDHAFAVDMIVTLSRNPDNQDLLYFSGTQFAPNFEYNVTRVSGTTSPSDHVLLNNKTAIVAFCLPALGPDREYPTNLRIGHNPVADPSQPLFEILDPVDVSPTANSNEGGRPDLGQRLHCSNLAPTPSPSLGFFGAGMSGFATAAWTTAGRYLGPLARTLLLPDQLVAATLGTLPPPPIGGRAPSLSPFKAVEPATIAPSAGTGQSAPAGSAVAVPPAVVVRNASTEAPVQGVSVTFAVTFGGGSITGPTAVTNASGVAAVGSWTLGTAPGTNTLTATATGLIGSPVVFTATGTPPVTLAISSGDNQSGFANQILTAPLVVVASQNGAPLSGAVVTFQVPSGGGSITPSATTNALGQAEAHWTLGPTEGAQTATASTPGALPVTFKATAAAAPPARAVLEWGATPSDLDFHLTGPTATTDRFHVYYASRGSLTSAPFASLDRDDTDSFGPETITISQLQAGGLYRFSVHDYINRGSTSSTALSGSTAKVTVYLASGKSQVFTVPINTGGTLWTVFTLTDGTISAINTMSYESNPSNITAFSILGRTADAMQSDATVIRDDTARHPK